MDSFGRPNLLGAERSIRLAKVHLDDASAELREGPSVNDLRRVAGLAAPGADIEKAPDQGQRWPTVDGLEPSVSWVGWVPGDGLAEREMTPAEIRVDEIQKLGERIGLISIDGRATDALREVDRIFAGRIDALRPEQPATVEEPAPPVDTGIRFRQDDPGITVTREAPWRHDGAALRLTVDYQPNASESGEYRVPPYQVDQIRAIADGRASWSDTSVPELDTPEKTPGDEQGAPTIGDLFQLLERVQQAQTDVQRVGAIDAGIGLLVADNVQPETSGLSNPERRRLSAELSTAIRRYL